MAKDSEEKDATRRTKIEDLPVEEKKLTGEDLKKVKGGTGLADGSDLKEPRPAAHK